MRNSFSLYGLACTIALVAFGSMPSRVDASLVADDDASDVTYNDGWTAPTPVDNGGSGFQAWSFISNEVVSGFGGGFIASGTSIDVSGEAFGVFGNNGGFGAAIRSFTGDLSVGQTFSIDMDNEDIGSGNSVGFGLRNSAGDNLFEFFFTGDDSKYQVNKLGGATDTLTDFTRDGLRLAFTLTDTDSFSLTIDRLSTGVGVDETVTGDLLTPILAPTDQGIEVLRMFNSNGGPDAFFNSISISAIPEPSAFLFGGLVCGVLGVNFARNRQRAKKAS